MSLINTMLRDLENRRAVEINRRDWQREVRSLPPARRQSFDRRLLLPALLALVALSLGAGWYFSGRTQSGAANILAPKIQSPEVNALNEVIKADWPSAKPANAPKEEVHHSGEPEKHVKTRKEKRAELLAEKLAAKRAKAEQLKTAEKPPLLEAKKTPIENLPAEKEITKGIVKTLSPISSREKAEQEFRRAQGLQAAGQSSEALSAFQQALQHEATFNPARQALVRLLMETSRPEEAANLLADGLETQPAQFNWAMTLARLRMEKGDLAGAARILAKAQPYAANSADYAGFQGHVEFRLGHFAAALERYRGALALSPNEGKWWFGLAQSLDAEGKVAEAREAYRRAVATGNLAQSLLSLAEQKLR